MTQESNGGGHDDFLHDIHFGSTFLHEGGADTDSLFMLRYNQKPASMDVAQAGLLWADTTAPGSLFASFPSTSGTVNGSNATNHHNEHYYSGKIEPAKEVDCMLIWDEALQSFSLERMDANVYLNVDRNGSHHRPIAATSSSTRLSAPKPKPPAAHQVRAPQEPRFSPAGKAQATSGARASSSDSSDLEIVSSVTTASHAPPHGKQSGSHSLSSEVARTSSNSTSSAALAAKTGSRGPPSTAQPEVEDFGDVSFAAPSSSAVSGLTSDEVNRKGNAQGHASGSARPKAPASSLPVGANSIPTPSIPSPVPKQGRSTSPAKPSKVPLHTSPKLSNSTGTPLSLPARSSPAPASGSESAKPVKPTASNRPPASTGKVASKSPSKTVRSSVSSKVPSAAESSSANKKGKRRASDAVASKVPAKMPLSKQIVSSSEGSSDNDVASSDSSASASGSEEDDGIPEGYLVRPGSILSSSTAAAATAAGTGRNGARAGTAMKRPPMKTVPAAAVVAAAADSATSSSGDSGSDEDEESDLDSLATNIVTNFQGPGAVRKGGSSSTATTGAGAGIGKGKGGPKRASKIPASMRGASGAGVPESRPSYASKIPASMNAGTSRIGRGKGGAKAPRKGSAALPHVPGSSTGLNTSPQLQQPEDDVPDSSEED